MPVTQIGEVCGISRTTIFQALQRDPKLHTAKRPYPERKGPAFKEATDRSHRNLLRLAPPFTTLTEDPEADNTPY